MAEPLHEVEVVVQRVEEVVAVGVAVVAAVFAEDPCVDEDPPLPAEGEAARVRVPDGDQRRVVEGLPHVGADRQVWVPQP